MEPSVEFFVEGNCTLKNRVPRKAVDQLIDELQDEAGLDVEFVRDAGQLLFEYGSDEEEFGNELFQKAKGILEKHRAVLLHFSVDLIRRVRVASAEWGEGGGPTEEDG